MDLTTIRGIAKARWWILVAAAILAVVVSGRLAEYRNENLPTFEAVTSVTFIEDPQALEREDFVTFLETQFALAQDVNSGILDETPGAFIPWLLAEIKLEGDQNQIQFIGRAYTQEESDQLAHSMRESFLVVSAVGAGQQRMSAELDTLTQQIGDLRGQIAQGQAATPLSPEEIEVFTQRAALESRIAALQGHIATLGTQLMNPDLVLRSPESIQAEMDRTLAETVALNTELANYPLPPDPAALAANNEELLLDQLRLQNLEARWQQLYIGERELDALAQTGPVDSQPVTLDATSPTSNQMLALFGALAAAMIGLVAVERGRGMMWSEKELDEGPPVLVELPSRPLATFHHPTNEPWYLETPGGRRKAAIQMLRSLLDDHDNAVVAFQGSGVFREDIRELTADVAVAVAVSGRSVLLIDAMFDKNNDMPEFGTAHGPTLSSLLQTGSTEREELISEFKTALLGSPEVVHGLRTLRAGNGKRDAADVLSGHRFELLMEVAREIFDLVLISGSNIGEAASHVLAQRVDSAILIGSAGHTVTRSLEAADREFSIRRATLLGVVFLRRRRTKLTRWGSTQFRAWLWQVIDRFSEWRNAKFVEVESVEVESVEVESVEVEFAEAKFSKQERSDE